MYRITATKIIINGHICNNPMKKVEIPFQPDLIAFHIFAPNDTVASSELATVL
jgi:hypothetical protein